MFDIALNITLYILHAEKVLIWLRDDDIKSVTLLCLPNNNGYELLKYIVGILKSIF